MSQLFPNLHIFAQKYAEVLREDEDSVVIDTVLDCNRFRTLIVDVMNLMKVVCDERLVFKAKPKSALEIPEWEVRLISPRLSVTMEEMEEEETDVSALDQRLQPMFTDLKRSRKKPMELSGFVKRLDEVSVMDRDKASRVQWELKLVYHKKPIVDQILKDEYAVGDDVVLTLFLLFSKFLDFLDGLEPEGAFNRLLGSKNRALWMIGEVGGSGYGELVCIVDPYSPQEAAQAVKAFQNLREDVRERRSPREKMPPILGASGVLPPRFFELRTAHGGNVQEVQKSLARLEIHSVLVALSHIAVQKPEREWQLTITGQTVLQSTVSFTQDELLADGARIDTAAVIGPLREFSAWVFGDGQSMKVRLARKVITHLCRDYGGFFTQLGDVRRSLEAVYDAYLDETSAEVMAVRQRFTDYVFSISTKNADFLMKLTDQLNEALLAGFAILLAGMLGWVGKAENILVVSLLLFWIPIVFIGDVILGFARIIWLKQAFKRHLSELDSQLNYYKRFVDKTQIEDLLPDTLIKEDFPRRANYCLAFLGIIALITVGLWFYLNTYLVIGFLNLLDC